MAIELQRDTLTNRVRCLLEGSPGEPWNPYEIARITIGKRDTIKKILYRLKKRGEIQQYRRGKHSTPFRGFYTYSPEIQNKEIREELEKELEIHNVRIFVSKPIIEIKGSQYQKLATDIIKEIPEKFPEIEKKEYQKMVYFYLDTGPHRQLTIGISKTTGSVQLWLKCGNHPLPIGEYPFYLRFLESVFSDWWHTSDSEVQWMELNDPDEYGININGLSNISVKDSENQLIHFYNKFNALRKEKRYYPKDLTPQALATEIINFNDKADNLVIPARITDLRNDVTTLKDSIREMDKENKDLRRDLRDLISTMKTMVQGSQYKKDPDLFSNSPFQTADNILDGDQNPPGYG